MRGQVAVEFMIIFFFLLLALTLVVVVAYQGAVSAASGQLNLEAERVAGTAAEKINTVYLEGPGFRTNLTLPEKVLELEYSITIEGNYISLGINNHVYIEPLLTQNITGTLEKGTNLIENREGEVVIT